MTPKEKARGLYENMLNGFQFNIDEYTAKQCALIAINEMLDFRNRLYINEGSLAHQYLEEIKKEINKIKI